MILFKIYYHIKALLQFLLFKIVYWNRFQVGRNVTWRSGFHVFIENRGRIKIGKNCFFNNGCTLGSLVEIIIGEGCLFGENVKIYDHNHRFRDSDADIKNQGYVLGSVRIGDHCWIGSNVTILKGVQIGNHCVVGSGCIIQENIDDNTIVKMEGRLIKEKIRH